MSKLPKYLKFEGKYYKKMKSKKTPKKSLEIPTNLEMSSDKPTEKKDNRSGLRFDPHLYDISSEMEKLFDLVIFNGFDLQNPLRCREYLSKKTLGIHIFSPTLDLINSEKFLEVCDNPKKVLNYAKTTGMNTSTVTQLVHEYHILESLISDNCDFPRKFNAIEFSMYYLPKIIGIENEIKAPKKYPEMYSVDIGGKDVLATTYNDFCTQDNSNIVGVIKTTYFEFIGLCRGIKHLYAFIESSCLNDAGEKSYDILTFQNSANRMDLSKTGCKSVSDMIWEHIVDPMSIPLNTPVYMVLGWSIHYFIQNP